MMKSNLAIVLQICLVIIILAFVIYNMVKPSFLFPTIEKPVDIVIVEEEEDMDNGYVVVEEETNVVEEEDACDTPASTSFFNLYNSDGYMDGKAIVTIIICSIVLGCLVIYFIFDVSFRSFVIRIVKFCYQMIKAFFVYFKKHYKEANETVRFVNFCMIVVFLILVIFYLTLVIVRPLIEEYVVSISTDEKVIGWGCVACVSLIMLLICFLMIILKVFEKGSTEAEMLNYIVIILICFTITCVTIVLEANDFIERYSEVIDEFYYEGNNNSEFVIRCTLAMFFVLMAFCLIYSKFIHKYMVIECDKLYTKENWYQYINKELDDIANLGNTDA